MVAPVESDTVNRILDAAEHLFLERGFSGTSLRAVTAEAGVNVAAVHYHLGSKEALLRAVIERRAAPINAERLAALARVLRENGGKPPSVEAIVGAFFGPVLESSRAPELRDVSSLMFREPVELVLPLVGQVFAEVSQRFIAALVAALPHLGPDEVFERFHLMLSVMVQAVSGRLEFGMRELRPAEHPLPSPESLTAAISAFVAAGLRAPSTRAPEARR